jgi:two-component system, OmpR family, sensor histidine kinase BaeS
MTWLFLAAALADASLFAFLAVRAYRSRRDGASLRLRIFFSLAAATLVGALFTGTYAVAEEAFLTGVTPVAERIAPKAFLLGSALLVVSAAGAAEVGRRLARSMEDLTESAARIASGELDTRLPRGTGREARALSRALASMRAELEGRPYAAAFLRDAWHDLKTPTTAIKATIELLEDGALDDPEAAQRFVRNLRRSADQLEHTLEDLVTLARFETVTLGPDRVVAIGDVIDAALESVRPLAEAKGVRLLRTMRDEERPWDPQLSVRGDQPSLTRALTNLLDNAVAATAGGEVRVELQHTSAKTGLAGQTTSDATVTLDVVNSPAHIPPEVRDRLFERAATSRQGGGSGLGLAIARAAVLAHGGRLHFVELGPPAVRLRIELPA